jgi:tripartite-type tricarboxylate transporter receptor subunit TctC
MSELHPLSPFNDFSSFISRRSMIQSGVGLAVSSLLEQSLLAQSTSLDNLRIVTGFSAGGTSDTLCRRLASKMAPDYAKSAVVDNRTGAGGQIAIQYIKSQPLDGTVVLQSPSSMFTIYPHIYKKLPYDPVADVTPVSLACVFDLVFAVGPMVPLSVKTLQDYLSWSKANPQLANFGSPAAGSTPHFVGMLVGRLAGINYQHVAYRGSQPAMLDLLGGNLAAVSAPIGDVIQHVSTGKVRMLVVSGAKRSRFAPEVPTFNDLGYKDMVYNEYFGIFLPPKAPPDVVARLNAALRIALTSKDVIDGLNTFGLEALSSSPQEFVDVLKRDTLKWEPIVKQVGFSAD